MLDATIETLYMSFVSLAVSWLIALPLGSLVSETRPGGLFPSKAVNFISNRLIDVGRSIPFILLVVFLFPFTRVLIGTAIGTTAMIVPLTICAVPFEARLVEEILSEVPYSIIEAAKIDGASNLKPAPRTQSTVATAAARAATGAIPVRLCRAATELPAAARAAVRRATRTPLRAPRQKIPRGTASRGRAKAQA